MAFANAIQRPDLISLSIRHDAQAVTIVKAAISEAIIKKTLSEWQTVFATIEACVEPVLSFAEACEHPQIIERQMLVDVPSPNGSTQKQIATPIVFSATPNQYRMTGTALGSHTTEVLLAHGFTEADIKSWQQQGIIMS